MSTSPSCRRAVVAAVRDVVLANLPEGYVESMNWGMISCEIPLERYPKTYNGRPLSYAALASRKNDFALYLSAICGDGGQEQAFRDAFAAAGKKLDMGKSCVRFRKLDDLPLDAIGAAVAAVPPEAFIRVFEASRKK